MSNDNLHDTGPWSLDALQTHLGEGTNRGRVHKNVFIGGEVEFVQEYGPFAFQCGCVAWRGGAGGDMYLTPCSKEHAALPPHGFN